MFLNIEIKTTVDEHHVSLKTSEDPEAGPVRLYIFKTEAQVKNFLTNVISIYHNELIHEETP